MQLLISGANILIDLEEGRLLQEFFQLPYKFQVPDILYFEELEEQHSHLLDFGLGIGQLTEESMNNALRLTATYPGPSRNDCFALALAIQQQCPLLTGDKDLRIAAEKEAVLVNGTLWVIEQLVIHRVINVAQAEAAYDLMKKAQRRLPWSLAFERLNRL